LNDQKVCPPISRPAQTVALSFGRWISPFRRECYSRSGESYWLLLEVDERLR